MPERLYGIRHHGPGSARAVVQELAAHPPDILLVEGPPEADDLVRWVADDALEPPVALLGYAADDPRRAAVQRGEGVPASGGRPRQRRGRHAQHGVG